MRLQVVTQKIMFSMKATTIEEIFVLDMGQPIKIVTLAENLIRMYDDELYKA